MKKVILALIICALTAGIAAPCIIKTQASAASVTRYEIYPTPQDISYGKTSCEIPQMVTLYLGEGLDNATINRAYEAISQQDILAYTDNARRGYSIYVGVYGSGDKADMYVQNTLQADCSHMQKNDAYLLDIGDDVAVVLGKDTDSAYYGLTTLKAIFAQVPSRTFRLVTIRDWSDSKYRGFIEGYYGVPWTTDERIELMRFGSEFKTNMYIYAPKDDPYHSANWRGLYTEADLQELVQQIDAGTQTKTRFVWAIHPFMQSVYKRSSYDADLRVLLAKFEQLYQAGVRQFALSADDIQAKDTDAVLQRDLCNDIVAWLKQKGDCYNLIFVPTYYWYAKPVETLPDETQLTCQRYFEELMGSGADTLDESVEIMWTGDRVCSTVSNGKFAEFTQMTGRKAFMWMNWPVNDYSTRRVLLGKGEVYNAKLNEDSSLDFTGIVTNPMQYAEADKIAVFATADYCWNVNGFDVDKSYSDCFKYIEPNCPDDLYAICQNLSNANKYEGRFFEESPQFVDLITEFNRAYANGEDLSSSAQALQTLFAQLVQHADNYLNNCQNQKLLENIQPFVLSLKLLSQKAIKYLQVAQQIDSLTSEQLTAILQEVSQIDQERAQCTTPVLNVVTYNHDQLTVEVGNAVLAPFVDSLVDGLGDDINLTLGLFTGIKYSGFDGIYEGSIENLMDGDLNTHTWFNGYPATDAYVRIDLGEVTEIKDVTLAMGKVGGGDTWNAKLQYSLDGKNFIDLQAFSGSLAVVDLRAEPVNARFLRIVNNNQGRSWVAIREVSINTLPPLSAIVTIGDGFKIYPYARDGFDVTILSNACDGDENTFVDLEKLSGERTITINILQSRQISQIAVLSKSPTWGDAITECKIEYSVDGVDWVTVGDDYTSENGEFYIPVDITCQYVRITVLNDSWITLREIILTPKENS